MLQYTHTARDTGNRPHPQRAFAPSQTVKLNKEVITIMKGYPVSYGYMGYVNGNWMLFATEAEYIEYMTT